MAPCTSTAAPSRLRSSANSSVICVEPSELTEVIDSSPAIIENWFSSGVATDEPIVSGLAPGRLAVTTALGRIVGIDPAPPRIEAAQQRRDPRLEFRIGQAQDLSQFPDATFDVAYMNSVLNWIDDRPKALGEAYRVLKPRGRFGIGTTVRDRPNQLRLLEGRAWKAARERATGRR